MLSPLPSAFEAEQAESRDDRHIQMAKPNIYEGYI
jgi:hypothetical protein